MPAATMAIGALSVSPRRVDTRRPGACCRRCRDVSSTPSIPIPSSKSQTTTATGRAIPTSPCRRSTGGAVFAIAELTNLVELAQTANLDIAVAVAQHHSGRRAIAALPGLRCCRPSCRVSQERTRASLLPATTSPPRRDAVALRRFPPGQPAGELHLDFWGQNRATLLASEQIAIASRFDRDIIALTAEVDRRHSLLRGARRAGSIAGRQRAISSGRVQVLQVDPRPLWRPAPPRSSRSPSRKACSTR